MIVLYDACPVGILRWLKRNEALFAKRAKSRRRSLIHHFLRFIRLERVDSANT